MLTHLTIRNFALVTELELSFKAGLTVITGESGAGKSILLHALGLVLGDRAQKSQIHPDATQCDVYAEFNISGLAQVYEYLQENDLGDSDDPSTCIVRRVATDDGRSRAWLNGRPVNLTVLRTLCSLLVGVHDQFEQREMMSNQVQLQWLDDYIGNPDQIDEVRTRFHAWQREVEAYELKKNQLAEANDRQELQIFQVEELREFDIQENEFEILTTKFKRLSQRQTLLESLQVICAHLDEQSIPATGRAHTELFNIEDTSEEIQSSRASIETAQINLEETSQNLHRFVEKLTSDPDDIESISNRLDQWHNLSRKHRVSATELPAKAIELENELELLQQGEQQLGLSAKECKVKQNEYYKVANALSLARQKASRLFSDEVVQTLAGIGLQGAEFKMDFSTTCSERGIEQVNYLISTNPGFEPQPLNQVASGGELSRVSLAILVVVAARSQLPCLILDEADIGMSGTTADEVGRTLRSLAEHTQILCVTHAPQVAALGDAHLGVTKSEKEGVTVDLLEASNRVEELARMVGGQEINAESRKYATVLLREAEKNT